jgi:hypothetical protein
MHFLTSKVITKCNNILPYRYAIKKTKEKSSIESAKPWRRDKTHEQEMCYVGRPIDGH